MKTKLITGLVAAALACSAGAATLTSQSGFYVVVPLQARAFTAAAGIDVSLSNAVLPSGLLGLTYPGYDFNTLLTVTGDETYTGYGVHWALTNGALPAGLSLNADGTVSGTPTANGTSSFTVQATYKTKTGETAYQLFIGKIDIAIDAGAPPQAIVGQAYSYDLKPLLHVDGDPSYGGSGVTWSVVSSSLPAGLALRTDGSISGTPTVGGTGTVVARASYRGSNGEQSYSVVTLSINVALANATPPQAIVGQAYSYDLMPHLSVTGDNAYTSGAVTWSVVSSSLAPGLVLNSTGTISGVPTGAGTGTVTARATYRGVNGEQTYQVVTLGINVGLATATLPQAIVGQAFSYDLKPLLNVTGDGSYDVSNVTWSVVSNSLPSGISLRTNGLISGTPTGSGTGTLVARATYRGVNGEQTYQLVTLNINVALSAGTPPQAIVGQAYSYDLKPLLNVTGDGAYDISNVSWSVVSNGLPAGLTLLANGTIAGTPTASGTGSLVARATYRGVNGQLSFQVVTLAISVNLASATPPAARVGEPYSYDLKPNLSVTGDPGYSGSGVSWSVVSNGLPSGLYLSGGGVITGTPTVATTGSLTARATYRAVNGQQSYSISAAPAWTYAWTPGSWTTPSACGPTTSTRSLTCVRDDSTTVADSYCVTAKPATTQAATDYTSCTYSWATAGWITPSSCGPTTATRSVTCLRSDGTTVADGSCTAAKPATTQGVTDYSACSYAWSVGGWNTPAACGSTTATRSITCLRSDGVTVADANCTDAKPAATQGATDYNSCTYAWSTSGWITPNACGTTTSTRSVTCRRSDGVTVADANCVAAKPAVTQSDINYLDCNYVWSTGAWTTPQACGATTSTRSVNCLRSDGVTVADSSCASAKPSTTQAATDYLKCTYSFSYSAYSACSASCGGGTQTRTATCVRSDGTTVANASCGTPVNLSQSCNTQSCVEYSWATGAWSAANGCGTVTQTRSVSCQGSDGSTGSAAQCGGTAPASSQTTTSTSTCTYTPTYSGWTTPAGCGSVTQTRSIIGCTRSDGTSVSTSYCSGTTTQNGSDFTQCIYNVGIGSWGSCSASCNGGTQYRSVSCTRSDGTAVSTAYCGSPAESQPCNTQACISYNWNIGDWSTPAGCGTLTQTRSVTCQASTGATVADSYCGSKPATSQSTTIPCTYSANTGSWGSCSASCGGGTQTRSVSCTRSDGVTVANSYCGSPATSQACNTQACSYTYSANIGGWGACSATCGGGTQTRSVSCTRSDGASVANSYCGSPATSQSCNTQACAPSYSWSGGTVAYGDCDNAAGYSEPASGSCSSKGATYMYYVPDGYCNNGVGDGTHYTMYVQTCK